MDKHYSHDAMSNRHKGFNLGFIVVPKNPVNKEFKFDNEGVNDGEFSIVTDTLIRALNLRSEDDYDDDYEYYLVKYKFVREDKYLNSVIGTDVEVLESIPLTSYFNVNFDLMDEFTQDAWIDTITSNQWLKKDFIYKHIELFKRNKNTNWLSLTLPHITDYEFLIKYPELFDWNIVLRNQIPEHVLEKVVEFIPMKYVSTTQNISEDFVKKHSKDIVYSGLINISRYSLEFYREHKDKIKWSKISKERILTDEFLNEFGGFTDPVALAKNPSLTPELAKKHKNLINWSFYILNPLMEEEVYWDNAKNVGWFKRILTKLRLRISKIFAS